MKNRIKQHNQGNIMKSFSKIKKGFAGIGKSDFDSKQDGLRLI